MYLVVKLLGKMKTTALSKLAVIAAAAVGAALGGSEHGRDAEPPTHALMIRGASNPLDGLAPAVGDAFADKNNGTGGSLLIFGRQTLTCPASAPARCGAGCCGAADKCCTTSCCPIGNAGTCCPLSMGGCCLTTENCVPLRDKCCPKDAQTCGGSYCWAAGATCCDGGSSACAAGSTCCGAGCCAAGKQCCGAGQGCCDSGETCCPGACKSLSLSLSPL
ncbi:hypothetical protein B0T26DRAFT_118920 [Lasiosphaeria miniovina]|uniref:Uncharacterized protein n=1 Tax=Lasiosphaeria miniovina TaxID=1954250 RepID=A0AA40E3X8_9PEZI|nr:uncharacterized protein B0T26DRAFT_118920 [Lasiosphaeria miniovina]KAK0727144.1 hypothetical protein B0T26DRAFT_118920 [Lasiosphaeria miniovina]